METVYTFVQHFTIINKFVIVLILIFQRKNKRFNWLLAGMIASVIPLLISNYMDFIKSEIFIERLFVGQLAVYFYLPFVLFFIYEVLGMVKKITLKTVLINTFYFPIPLVLMFIYEYMTPSEKMDVWEAIIYYQPNPLLDVSNYCTFFISLVYPCYFIYFLMKLPENQDKEVGPDYISRVRYVKTLVLLIWASTFLMVIAFFIHPRFANFFAVPMLSNAVVFYIVYQAFKRQFVLIPASFEIKAGEKGKIVRKQKLLSNEMSEKYANIVVNTILTDELFTDSDISIDKISKKIDMPRHQLSYIINDHLRQTFPELINVMRIERAKQVLQTDLANQLSIEGIGKECGFKSKSAFYSAFRKSVGMTPKQFLDKSSP